MDAPQGKRQNGHSGQDTSQRNQHDGERGIRHRLFGKVQVGANSYHHQVEQQKGPEPGQFETCRWLAIEKPRANAMIQGNASTSQASNSKGEKLQQAAKTSTR